MTVLFAASWDCDFVGEQVFGDRSVSAEAVDVEDADFVGDMVIGDERGRWYSDGRFPVSFRVRILCVVSVQRGSCENSWCWFGDIRKLQTLCVLLVRLPRKPVGSGSGTNLLVGS
jgi:hypothetical protein